MKPRPTSRPPRSAALAPFDGRGRREPVHAVGQELQQTMNDLVGIIRTGRRDLRGARASLAGAQAVAPEPRDGRGQAPVQPRLAPLAGPAEHAASCPSASRVRRSSGEESRGGHTRDDFPVHERAPGGSGQPGLLAGSARSARAVLDVRRHRGPPAAARHARRAARAVRPLRAQRSTSPPSKSSPDCRPRTPRKEPTDGLRREVPGVAGRRRKPASSVDFTRWRSTRARSCSTSSTGCRRRRRPDLAVRWNCKAGKCGSCSAEINGRPRLLCMTRMSTFDRRRDDHGDPAARVPRHPRPRHRRLVQLRRRRATVPSFAPPEGLEAGRVPHAAGRRRAEPGVPQVHRVLPLPGHLPRRARPRGEQGGLLRSPFLHPPRRARHAPARHPRPQEGRPVRARPRLLQHHQVLHRGLPRAHQDHRQRDHPDEGARRRT